MKFRKRTILVVFSVSDEKLGRDGIEVVTNLLVALSGLFLDEYDISLRIVDYIRKSLAFKLDVAASTSPSR